MDERDDHTWEHDMIEDIGHDTDSIIKMLGSGKMGESFDSGALMGMLANKGIDPGIVAMLNDCKKDGSWGDGGMLIVLFLILILGFGGNGGFFGRGQAATADALGIDRTIYNQSNFDALNSAISTQGTRQEIAINQLANTFGCTCGQIQTALAGLDKELAVTGGNTINAIQNVGCQLGQQISDCCCRQTAALERATCGINSNIQESRYNTASQFAAQTALLQSQHCETINTINNGFASLELRDLQRALDQKNAEINDLKLQVSQTAQTAQIIAAINAKSESS